MVDFGEAAPAIVRVSGVDISRPLSREDAAAIDVGMDTYAVLVLRGQRATDEQQIAFSLNFGELESYKTPAYVQGAGGPRLGKGWPISPI